MLIANHEVGDTILYGSDETMGVIVKRVVHISMEGVETYAYIVDPDDPVFLLDGSIITNFSKSIRQLNALTDL